MANIFKITVEVSNNDITEEDIIEWVNDWWFDDTDVYCYSVVKEQED